MCTKPSDTDSYLQHAGHDQEEERPPQDAPDELASRSLMRGAALDLSGQAAPRLAAEGKPEAAAT